jgi:hypothetical protein
LCGKKSFGPSSSLAGTPLLDVVSEWHRPAGVWGYILRNSVPTTSSALCARFLSSPFAFLSSQKAGIPPTPSCSIAYTSSLVEWLAWPHLSEISRSPFLTLPAIAPSLCCRPNSKKGLAALPASCAMGKLSDGAFAVQPRWHSYAPFENYGSEWTRISMCALHPFRQNIIFQRRACSAIEYVQARPGDASLRPGSACIETMSSCTSAWVAHLFFTCIPVR